tara:strand:+ start:1824 stop:2222 length:399 start_codon:yes stop_codon:yes gene_type:complete
LEERKTQFSDTNFDFPFHKRPANAPIQNVFNNLLKKERTLVQVVLRDLNIYNSEVDGLYGPSTVEALKTFNEKRFQKNNLEKKENVSKLIGELLSYRNALSVKQVLEKRRVIRATLIVCMQQIGCNINVRNN